MSSDVQFGISYSGSTKFKDTWDIAAIDVKIEGFDADVSVDLTETKDREATQYPKFQIIPRTGHALDYSDKRQFDSIHAEPAMAKTMQLSARIFEVYKTLYKTGAKRDDLPVFFSELPEFEAGKSYLIQIVNRDNTLMGTIVAISARELQRQVRFARCYPHSMIYSSQETTHLTPDQEKIYEGLTGAIYAIGGWIDRFAKEVKMSPPENLSSYERVTKETLRQLVQQIEKEPFEALLELYKEGDVYEDFSQLSTLFEKGAKLQLAAIGGIEGYAMLMRNTLEAFAGDKASQHKEKIEEFSQQFANCYIIKESLSVKSFF